LCYFLLEEWNRPSEQIHKIR